MEKPATTDAHGVVALTEKLLRGSRHSGASERDRDTHSPAATDFIGVLGAEQLAAHGQRDGDLQFNFESTFRFMTQRRLQRRYRGVYKQYSFTAQLVTWLVVLYTLSTLATLAFRTSNLSVTNQSDTSSSATIVVIILVVVYVFVRVALLIRWLVYWAVFAAMLVYAVTSEIESVFWLDGDEKTGVALSAAKKHARNGIMIGLAVVEVLTVVVYFFTHYTYPWLVLNNKFDTLRWWDVKRHPSRGNTLTYRSKARSFYTVKRNLITYCGGLDDQRRPHGFGMWTDTSFHGERLTGQWNHGIPIAPYRSFEHGSGYCFVNIRVGYCHVRSEDRPDQISFIPKHSSDGLHWGVGSVECSVSGGFFKFLPSVRHITPHNGSGEDVPTSAIDCERLLRSPTDAVTFHDEPKAQGVRPSQPHPIKRRFPSARRLLFKENSCPILDTDEQSDIPVPLSQGDKEAVILLHGYNCSLNYAMGRLAQLLALGDFPTNIHPFVFSWPSGGALAYLQARNVGSESEETAQAFRDFLRSLADAGYTTIHIIAHSMGARVFFSALEKDYLDDVFERDDGDAFISDASSHTRRARLATLTFANADYDRSEFVKRGGGFDKSRRFCRLITVYADNMDGALFYLEILSKKTLFGPLNYSIGKRGHMLYRDPGDDNVGDGSTSGNVDQPNHDSHNLVPAGMDVAVALVNQRGHYDGVTSFAFNGIRSAESSAEAASDRFTQRSLPSRRDQPHEYLDIDVIDTTWMDNNVHSIRHNYFNLNPTVVEDLRCLVVDQQRASSRPGLLKTNDNVYIFLVAPSHIKNK